MEKNFFVILNHPTCELIEMTDHHGDMSFFTSEAAAIDAGSNSAFGEAYGFEVFEIGSGVYSA